MQQINIVNNKEKQNSAKFYIAELTNQRDQPELLGSLTGKSNKTQRIVLNLYCDDLTVFSVELIQSQ